MNRWALYALSLLVLASDQASKSWIARDFATGESRSLGPFFALTLVHNTGGAFGILPTGTWLLAIAAAAASIAIVAYTLRAHALPGALGWALALPLGGALGNLCDRVRLGYVVDFLDWHVGAHQWPVSNVADVAICVGVGLLAIYFWRLPAAPPEAASPLAAKE